MIKVSELIGRPLLDLSKAALFTVGNIMFDFKKNSAVALEVICPDEDCEYKYVKYSDVYKIDEAITVKNSAMFFASPKPEYRKSPINLVAYSQSGKNMGRISDIELDGAVIKSFITDSSEFFFPVISASDQTIIFNDTGKPFNTGIKSKIKVNDTRTVKIMSNKLTRPVNDDSLKTVINKTETSNANSNVETPSKPDITTVIHSPNTAPVTKYDFLLGKRADKDIYSNYGKLIVGINELITNEIILNAKDEGKLVQLAMHSR